MNYNKIKILIEERNITLTKLADSVGFTREGFSRMLKDKTMKVETLEKIANVLNVPVQYFFDDNEKLNEVSEATGEYSSRNKELTNQLLASKDEQIKQLQEQVEFLKHLFEK